MLRATIGLTVLFGLLGGAATAQTTLPTTMPPATPALGLSAARVSYSLNAGFMTAGRYGSASYLAPLASYQLTRRMSVFAGLTYLHVMPGVGRFSGEANRSLALTGQNRYLVQMGGAYALSPTVTLVGSAWKDLTPNPAGLGVNRYSGFSNMGSGVNMRADFKVSEHMTLSGGVRVSNGAAPGYSPLGVGPFGY